MTFLRSQWKSTWGERIGIVAFCLIMVFLLSVRLAPSVIGQGRDNGIFSYTGWVIREGGLPYRDAWDNKPPGIYYIDAFAFVLFGVNRWALWLMENSVTFITALAFFWLLRQVFKPRFIAWIGTLFFLLLARSPLLIWDINFTEGYALLPQVLCWIFGYQFLRQPSYKTAFLIGLSSAAAFLIKQTTVGMAFAFIPAILLTRHPVLTSPKRWLWLGTIIAGGLLGLGVVVAFLAAHGLTKVAFDATFISPGAYHEFVNKEYPHDEYPLLIQLLMKTIISAASIIIGPALPFVIAGTIAVRRRVTWKGYADQREATNALVGVWAGLTLLIDLLLVNITFRAYEHYFLTIIPALVLLILPAFTLVPSRWPRWASRMTINGMTVYLVFAFGIAGVVVTGYRLWAANGDIFRPVLDKEIAIYAREHTSPDEMVLDWGATSSVNFQSQRFSPTQFHYGYPLILPGYTTEDTIEEYLHDWDTYRPALVVDSTVEDGRRVPPLDPIRRARWYKTNDGRRDIYDLTPIYIYFFAHCYHPEAEIGQTVIYRCEYDD